ncbi:MAG: patatin-like phospholipase family protein [Nitrosomonas sp.]|nr:patatin-like phospholipase family protein [Nitrosomonas sp.]
MLFYYDSFTWLAMKSIDSKLPKPAPSNPDANIGIALGSGSARGLAHIGVLRALQEHDIKIDLIAGSSIGALIGAVYADGNLPMLESSFKALDWRKLTALLDLTVPRSGLIEGNRVTTFIKNHLSHNKIEDLPLPFCAIATDILSAKKIILREGNLVDAIRASISVPGIFTPVQYGEKVLVDGGLIDPVPVSTLRKMGANYLIAVDLNHQASYRKTRKSKPLAKITPLPAAQEISKPSQQNTANISQSLIQRMLQIRRMASSIDNDTSLRFRKWLTNNTSPNIFEIILSSINIMAAKITENQLAMTPPDLLIQPPLGDIHFLAFDQAEKIIEIGYQSAQQSLARIDKKALNESLPQNPQKQSPS